MGLIYKPKFQIFKLQVRHDIKHAAVKPGDKKSNVCLPVLFWSDAQMFFVVTGCLMYIKVTDPGVISLSDNRMLTFAFTFTNLNLRLTEEESKVNMQHWR